MTKPRVYDPHGYLDLTKKYPDEFGPHGSVIQRCQNCGSYPDMHEVENHSLMWHDGDVVCTICDTYVRAFDAG